MQQLSHSICAYDPEKVSPVTYLIALLFHYTVFVASAHPAAAYINTAAAQTRPRFLTSFSHLRSDDVPVISL